MTTLRMKCFWGPYICILAGVALAHRDLWMALANKLTGSRSGYGTNLGNLLRHLVLAFVVFTLYNSYKQKIHEELQDLR